MPLFDDLSFGGTWRRYQKAAVAAFERDRSSGQRNTHLIAPQTKGRDHSSYTVIVDAQGRQRISFPANELTPRGLASDLAKF